MKPTALAVALLTWAGVVSGKHYVELMLEDPQNWVGGPGLFPSRVLAGYEEPDNGTHASTWVSYLQGECSSLPRCTAFFSFRGFDTGELFGYLLGGSSVTIGDFVRAPWAANSTVWNVYET
ncbi:predicted protein [Histoplasma capsulatum G186AR]|uniref:Uncharacterized protein n=2 Tax=Ajellomyces capsulatus TaxID=5037 RepID=C0NT23_AJECG|nr:uncharacterized protein HCBG_06303 [Histoplasma capsulatum G186AR]EEH05184.1 predicted protein [Histoplasma capsulatum G186AR]KAG5305449.1 hypothetical protein I7I52_04114 [Histoplasma capsulatum]QSS76411.1 hypothetical protein I7I50_05855 [Histoplasma capsulatum G186AR]